MSGLRATYKTALTFAATAAVSKFQWASPTNQKCWVMIGIKMKGTGSGAYCPTELRRGTTIGGGALSAAVTFVKQNGMDTETVQGSGKTYSSQPNNDGSIVQAEVIKDDRYFTFKPQLVNGGETLDLWMTPGSSAMTADLVVDVEQ